MENQVSELTHKIQQLEQELKRLKDNAGYGLKREDKPEEFEAQARNALPILQEDPTKRIDNHHQLDHIIIEGDNFHSLSALNYTHRGAIDVIYIDPPYNTGNKDFIYNDSFVDKEDSYRHSKRLSFIHKRLQLAKNLLSDQGVIFISIDDNEQAALKLLCDKVFGEESFIGNFIRKKKKKGSHLSKSFRSMTEYVLAYGKNSKNITLFGEEAYSDKQQPLAKRTNSIKTLCFPKDKIQTKLNDGKYDKGIKGKGTSSLDFINEFEVQNGIVISEIIVNGPFVRSQKNLEHELKQGTIPFLSNQFGFNVLKGNQSEKTKTPSSLIDSSSGVGTNEDSREEILNIFGEESVFDYPKPTSLIGFLVNTNTYFNKNSTILDFFAGSGTTGHAVLQLNAEDGGNRKFILCSNRENTKENPDKNICKDITYERVKRVMQGYQDSKGQTVEGLGGGNLRYYTTQFVQTTKATDDLRYRFIDLCDDLLCIKEDTFTEVPIPDHSQYLKIFKKDNRYTVILYDIHHFDELVSFVQRQEGSITIYIFSLSKEIYEEELAHISDQITVQNIPDDILQTYKKIFNF